MIAPKQQLQVFGLDESIKSMALSAAQSLQYVEAVAFTFCLMRLIKFVSEEKVYVKCCIVFYDL